MKYIRHFIGSLFMMAGISLALSALFSLCQLLLSLASVCDPPTWQKFFGGAIVLFIIFFLNGCFQVLLYYIRCRRDPVFKQVNLKSGLSWRDYKRLKKEKR